MDQGNGKQVDEWLVSLVEGLRAVHDQLIEIGGGAQGERTAALFAACARPYHTFDGRYLHADSYERAAALFHGIICDHPFVDGNKRTGTLAGIYVLLAEGTLAEMDQQGSLRIALLGQVALNTATGKLNVQQIAVWMRRIFEPGPAR